MRVLFVCLGNICRSPTAHGVFREIARREAPGLVTVVDSAGTAAYHVGEQPDPRTRRVAAATAIPPTPSATANNAPSLRSMTAATTPSTIGGQQRIATDPSNHRIADHTARAAPAAPSECAITQ